MPSTAVEPMCGVAPRSVARSAGRLNAASFRRGSEVTRGERAKTASVGVAAAGANASTSAAPSVTATWMAKARLAADLSSATSISHSLTSASHSQQRRTMSSSASSGDTPAAITHSA